jgi:hypothetical protein
MSDSIATQIGSYAGYISMVMMIIGTVISAMNHKRIRSACCNNRELVVSLDIEPTTPPEKKPEVKI